VIESSSEPKRWSVLPPLRRALRLVYLWLSRTPASALIERGVFARLRQAVTATQVGGGDVNEIVARLTDLGMETWLAGGWACDALLAEQTRPLSDLDLIISESEKDRVLSALKADGFTEYKWHGAGLLKPAVDLTDHRRRRVSLHLVEIDAGGTGAWVARLQKAADEAGLQLDEPFTVGTVDGCDAPCASACTQLVLHIGYCTSATDWHDIKLLCAHSGLALPAVSEDGTRLTWTHLLDGEA
jgi:hypothetical protein